jgi:hypothetical protein
MSALLICAGVTLVAWFVFFLAGACFGVWLSERGRREALADIRHDHLEGEEHA